MMPDRVSNPGPLTYESGALPIALRGPASMLIQICVASETTLHTHIHVCRFCTLTPCASYDFVLISILYFPPTYTRGCVLFYTLRQLNGETS